MAPNNRITPGQGGQTGERPEPVNQKTAAPRPIDEAAAARLGIRKLSGKHLTLFTDLPIDAEIGALPSVFDQAVPQWCDYFAVSPAALTTWHIRGSLMRDRDKFVAAGLLPREVPPFRHGYALGDELWIVEQPTAYYRRHLLLHEGTHAFMNAALGSCGPPWYMEGVAELLATHSLQNEKLRLNHFPASRDEVPMLGRIKMIQDAVAQQRGMAIAAVVAYGNRAHLQNEPYAWCWALAAFLDRHPRYQGRFRTLYRHVDAPNFNDHFAQMFADDWQTLNCQWQCFVETLEHGHDIAATAVDFARGRRHVSGVVQATVSAAGGWQNTGLWLDAEATYQFTAHGRYKIAADPRIWWCEPGGVTLRYYRGYPLGVLLAAVVPDDPQQAASALLNPAEIGLHAVLTPPVGGTLYLRVNDSAGELHDNAGELAVEIDAGPSPAGVPRKTKNIGG